MQGDVKITKQFAGVGINDDVGLERGADRLGEIAMQLVDNNGKGLDKNTNVERRKSKEDPDSTADEKKTSHPRTNLGRNNENRWYGERIGQMKRY